MYQFVDLKHGFIYTDPSKSDPVPIVPDGGQASPETPSDDDLALSAISDAYELLYSRQTAYQRLQRAHERYEVAVNRASGVTGRRYDKDRVQTSSSSGDDAMVDVKRLKRDEIYEIKLLEIIEKLKTWRTDALQSLVNTIQHWLETHNRIKGIFFWAPNGISVNPKGMPDAWTDRLIIGKYSLTYECDCSCPFTHLYWKEELICSWNEKMTFDDLQHLKEVIMEIISERENLAAAK